MSQYWVDEEKANDVREFLVDFCRHSKGEWAGRPLKLLDWQYDEIVMPVFGTLQQMDCYLCDGQGHDDDGELCILCEGECGYISRRYRRAHIEVPKKNGKSTLCAGLTLFLLLGDGELGAEVYTAASDHNQAAIIFREAASMVKKSPGLRKYMEINKTQKQIFCRSTDSMYQALSADVPTKEGLNIHGLVFDELHVQKSRDLWDTLTYGGAARRQPLQIAITTAGVYDPESIGWEQHSYAKGVLEGVIEDPSFFAYIKAADPEDDWKDPEVWKAANPSWGRTIKPDSFEEAAREAMNEPRKLNSFLRYRLNIWTQQAELWLDMERWNDCDDPLPPLDSLNGRSCFGGLDLASTTDIAALVLLFSEGNRYRVYPWFWVPEEAVKKRERINQPIYRNWIREGWLEVTPGDCTDYRFIRQTVQSLGERFDIKEIAFDPWNATQLATELSEDDGFNLVEFRQGYASMNEASKELERLVLDRRLVHGGNPVLRWMANNVAVDTDPAGNIKPSKKVSTEKIDGIVATIMALGRAMMAVDNTSVYETRGLLEV